MRILGFSDLHLSRDHAADLVAVSAGADLVIGAGDFCLIRQGLNDAMSMLAGLQAPLVVVPGNAESVDELRAATGDGVTVLHGQGCDIGGVRLFGVGYAVPVTPFGPTSCDLTEGFAADMLAGCDSADILITHSPPRGVADRTAGGQSLGSTAIHAAIERIQPRLALCGHIHDSWGQEGRIGATRVVNLGPRVTWFEVNP